METEVLFTPDHVMPRLYDVSPVLLAESPESVVITTRRGRESPLACGATCHEDVDHHPRDRTCT